MNDDENGRSTNYLADIASQNFLEYNLKYPISTKKTPYEHQGENILINKNIPITQQLVEAFKNFFNEKFLYKRPIISMPFIDETSKIPLVSLSRVCDANSGVFAIDLYLSDLVEDVTYFGRYYNTYAFMIDTNGKTIMHPSFPRPVTITNLNIEMRDISSFETVKGFESVRSQLVSQDSGNITIEVEDDKSENYYLSYSWNRSDDYYVIVIVSRFNKNSKVSVNLKNLSPYAHIHKIENVNMLYHLDVYPTIHNFNHFCKHFKQMATLESGSVYLSASSFQSPFYYLQHNSDSKLNRNASLQNIQPFLAYIKDTTRLLANPGLTSEVRNDVALLQKVMILFKEKFASDESLKNYIIRRYITTINGVMQVYPGTLLNTNFEPTRRNWYKRAMEYPGKIVVTEPYLDLGGAGTIVTVSHTIFEGKANALHNENDLPVAVVSIDFTHGWFYKLILKSSNFCSELYVKCFIMDDKGYLISHPSILQPNNIIYNSRRPAEHITHKESYVANDILNHEILIKKKLCANYLNQTIERFYQLNTSLDTVLTNVVHGERTKYQIALIASTNIFVGIVNSSYDGDAFCPCSTVNRLCLNCNRMEQTECECPCECPIDDLSDNSANTILNGIAVCPAMSEKFSPKVMDGHVVVDIDSDETTLDGNEVDQDEIASATEDDEFELKACVNVNCDSFTTQFACLGKINFIAF